MNTSIREHVQATSGFAQAVMLFLLTAAVSGVLTPPAAAITTEELLVVVGQSADENLGRSVAPAGDVNGDGFDDIIIGRTLFLSRISSTSASEIALAGGGADFGFSKSGAGDFNADGYSDFIVGSYGSNKTYIYLGRAIPIGSPDLIPEGPSGSVDFGYSVSAAGDVNGDGYDDVIIGAPGADAGNAFVYFGGADADTLADLTLVGEAVGDEFGCAVSGAGDVNGDGFSDLLVGARLNGAGGVDAGRAYVFYGGTGGDVTADLVFTGATAGDEFGASLSILGDLNSDGFADIVVGARKNDAGGINAGRAYVFHGGPVPDTTADLVLTGVGPGDNFGMVAAAGDVDGDAAVDMIVGAPLNDAGGIDAGQVYVFFGGAAMDTAADLIFTGYGAGDQFGSAVATAGDMDADGFGELIAGAPYDDTGDINAGRAIVYSSYPYRIVAPNGGETWSAGERQTVRWLGHDIADLAYSADGGATWYELATGVGGLNDNAHSLIVPSTVTDYALLRVSYSGQPVALSTSDLSNDVFRIAEPAEAYPHHLLMAPTGTPGLLAAAHFGWSIAGAGDIDNDGYGDMIVGEYSGVEGAASLFLLGPSADDVVDLVLLSPEFCCEGFGTAVSSAGHLNDDVYGDFVLGAPDSPVTPSGLAYVYFGQSTITPSHTLASMILVGEANDDKFGSSVALAGDVNADGHDDIIVGAPNANVSTGKAYVYFGGPLLDTTADLVLTGEGIGTRFGAAVSGVGDVDADGYDDILVGAPVYGGATPFEWQHYGRAYLFRGGPSVDDVCDMYITGPDTFSYLGASVAGAGDINGDGHNDFAVGVSSIYQPAASPGSVYVYYGGPYLDDQPDLVFTGTLAEHAFGTAIAAGDANGDGFSDLLIGEGDKEGYYSRPGHAYLFLGGFLPDTEVDLTFTGDEEVALLGAAVAMSDVNGDARADIMIGAPYHSGITKEGGQAYLYELNSFHLLAPNGNETWHVGTHQTVTWLGSEPADIWLSADGGAFWEMLEAGVGGQTTNSLPIFVPNRPTHYALIKVARMGVPYFGSDRSDTLFTINASIVTKHFTAEINDDGGALISWETDPGPEDLAGYRLEKKFALPGTDEDWTEVVALTRQTSYHDEEATSGTRYRLNAINGLGFEYVLGETAFGSTALLAAWPLPYRGGDLTVSFATVSGPGGGNGKAQVRLYDVAGRCVRTLVDGSYPPGYHLATWDGRGDGGQRMASGVYFLRAESGAHKETRKVVIVR